MFEGSLRALRKTYVKARFDSLPDDLPFTCSVGALSVYQAGFFQTFGDPSDRLIVCFEGCCNISRGRISPLCYHVVNTEFSRCKIIDVYLRRRIVRMTGFDIQNSHFSSDLGGIVCMTGFDIQSDGRWIFASYFESLRSLHSRFHSMTQSYIRS